MIRVTVEMVPHGDESRAYTMAEAIIVNDGSGTLETGNYRYSFTRVRSKNHSAGRQGELKNFPRKRLNVWRLLQRCMNDAWPK